MYRELGERQLWRRQSITAASAEVQPSFEDEVSSPDFHVKVLNLISWLSVLALDNAQRDVETSYSTVINICIHIQKCSVASSH